MNLRSERCLCSLLYFSLQTLLRGLFCQSGGRYKEKERSTQRHCRNAAQGLTGLRVLQEKCIKRTGHCFQRDAFQVFHQSLLGLLFLSVEVASRDLLASTHRLQSQIRLVLCGLFILLGVSIRLLRLILFWQVSTWLAKGRIVKYLMERVLYLGRKETAQTSGHPREIASELTQELLVRAVVTPSGWKGLWFCLDTAGCAPETECALQGFFFFFLTRQKWAWGKMYFSRTGEHTVQEIKPNPHVNSFIQ